MAVNVDLLEEVMQVIETYPEDWDQSRWIAPCGTAFCFAGHAILRTHPQWSIEIDRRTGQSTGCLLDENGDLIDESFGTLGKEALGLDWEQSSDLFAGSNSKRTLRRLVDRFKREAASSRGVPTQGSENGE